MSDDNSLGLRKIKRALISVSDKTGIVDFARQLKDFDIEIISTGGTSKTLRAAGIEVRDVSDVTGFPEIMDGRVKTLHPKIHGGLLGVRDNPEHQTAMREHGIEPIDLVVVNLYPFEETITRADITEAEAVEQIDIGGPAMIRSAAKNWRDVAVVVLSKDYATVIEQMGTNEGSLTLEFRNQLASEAFAATARYDALIFAYLIGGIAPRRQAPGIHGGGGGFGVVDTAFSVGLSGVDAAFSVNSEGVSLSAPTPRIDSEEFTIETFHGTLPGSAQWSISKTSDLRYGENPHQIAGLYQTGSRSGIANAQLLSGKEMSFNNYVDADAAWQLVCDFDEPACAIIKHTNPAGVALGANTEQAYRRALATDPTSAFGGVVASNLEIDAAAARAITEIFTEVLIAPDYEPEALEILKTKKNLRVLKAAERASRESVEYKQISGGMLVQTRDSHILKREDLNVVTNREPTDDEIRDLMFAWVVCKHTKSNAIVYARNEQTVGVGAGQMSRVDSVKLGAMRAQLPVAGSVLASDAFFPFRDGIDEAAKHGITAVIQPGGSMRDVEVIAAANEHGLAMVFTGIRHFKH